MDRRTKDIDIVSLRKRKNRRKKTAKFLIIAFLIAISVLLYAKKDKWFPKLEGIGSKFQSVKSNNGELAGGNFPLSISGGIDYQVSELNGYLAILSDAYLYIYTEDGELYEERQHAFANAMLQTAGKKALIYESGGTQFRVDSRRKKLYSKKLEESIIFARISNDGTVAVITTSESYVCTLTVFDESGEQIYSRNCVERVVDLAFSEDGTECVLATSDASNGKMTTNLISVSFDSKKDKWSSESINSLCIKTYFDENGILVLGDSKCAYYDKKGNLLSSYDYPSNLIDWDYSDGKVAMLFENEIKRHNYFTTIDSETRTPNEKEFLNSGAKCIKLADDFILLLNKDGISRFDFKGTGEKKISSESAYESFMMIDDYIFLLGYDRIDRIEY